MSNVFDYLAWRGDLPFSVSAFNAVDSLILSRLSYLPFDGVVSERYDMPVSLAEAAVTLLSRPRAYQLEDDVRLLRTLASAPRFRHAALAGYVNRTVPADEKQFAALCISPEGELPYISFRGTDGTLVGWKEDFNMASNAVVPSQRDAVDYFNAAATCYSGRLRVGGHSKGGNLAAYAAAFCETDVQPRIEAVYNHDGPGFFQETVECPAFRKVRSRIHTFVPQSSVIGILLQHEEETTVVKSTNTFLLQHDLYSWETNATGLVLADARTSSSRYIDTAIRTWLQRMRAEDRERLIDGLYRAMVAAGAVTVSDLRRPRIAAAIWREVRQMDEPTRDIIKQGFELLRGSARESLKQGVRRVK